MDGVGPVTLKKLTNAGINSVEDFVVRGHVSVAEIVGCDLDQARNWVEKAKDAMQESGDMKPTLRTANEVLEERLTLDKLKTGCKSLDDLLEGGMEVGQTTELYGGFASGKTQLCLQLAAMVTIPKEKGGLDGDCLYLDTEHTFRPERIRTMILRRGLVPTKEQSKEDIKNNRTPEPENEDDVKQILDKIIHAKILGADHQHWVVEHFGEILQDHPNIKLLIIDSVINYFRGQYLGRGNLSARQIDLNKHITMICNIANIYKIAVVWTNQVYDKVEGIPGDPTTPAGGHTLSHKSSYRIYMKKSGKKHIARMADSPQHAPNETLFDITSSGVVDYVDDKK